jgi:hypothetical protein
MLAPNSVVRQVLQRWSVLLPLNHWNGCLHLEQGTV